MEEIKKEEIKPKKKISKKVLSFVVVGVLALVLVTAAVVTYLSNTATVDISITQAMQVSLNGLAVGEALHLPSVSAGSSIPFTIHETNVGNNPVQVYNVLLEVTSPKPFTGNEFDSINLTDNGRDKGNVLGALMYIKSNGEFHQFTSIGTDGQYANSNGTYTANLMFASDGANLDMFSFGNGVTHTSQIVITTNSGIAPGLYTIKACDVNTLPSSGTICA
jgi:flagellar basal body-associated protein FliL